MKKQELLKIMDQELLDKLFGFCYARTSDSQEARELCSDIVFELVKAANAEGDIANLYGFLWRIARNTYADFSNRKRRYNDASYEGDPEDVFRVMASPENQDDSQELLQGVYRQIAFLTRAYREVMILYYLDGLSVAEIARRQKANEGAIQQRLFSARKKIRSEVEDMAEINQKPVVLDRMEYSMMGSGIPTWGDPRSVCTRQFSKHLVWLCRKKPISAAEAAEELHVPTVYVEEELEILTQGENGQYGLLRKLDNGRYAINFILFDREEIRALWDVYEEQIPAVCRIVSDYVEAHKEEYMAFPYLNRKVDWNLILWQQVHSIPLAFGGCVGEVLAKKHFAQIESVRRPFNVYGHVWDDRRHGGGWNATEASNVCGYSHVRLDNIDNAWIKAHFWYGHNVANDIELQLAVRAVEGLSVDSLSEEEKEHAAKAIECGYLYREGEMLYTKILVCEEKNRSRLFDITSGLNNGYLAECAETVAAKLSGLICRFVPKHLLGEWGFANDLAALTVLDALIEHMIKTGLLTPPENGVGAEGCWMGLEK